jgi:hypothetical protein
MKTDLEKAIIKEVTTELSVMIQVLERRLNSNDGIIPHTIYWNLVEVKDSLHKQLVELRALL